MCKFEFDSQTIENDKITYKYNEKKKYKVKKLY